MAVVPIVQEAQVPMISCAAAEVIVKPVEERKWVFKTPQMDADAVIRIYEHMKSKGKKKVALITGTTGFGADQGARINRLGLWDAAELLQEIQCLRGGVMRLTTLLEERDWDRGHPVSDELGAALSQEVSAFAEWFGEQIIALGGND